MLEETVELWLYEVYFCIFCVCVNGNKYMIVFRTKSSFYFIDLIRKPSHTLIEQYSNGYLGGKYNERIIIDLPGGRFNQQKGLPTSSIHISLNRESRAHAGQLCNCVNAIITAEFSGNRRQILFHTSPIQ